MTTHPTPAERLLSMLEDDRAVEALPAGEVREQLAAFGVDPARSISFARALAGGGDSPGGRLMGALLAGEEEDEEIARIESADIAEVRARVHHGAAAAIAAEARRKAGIDDNVIGLAEKRRKRRRRLIVWGGPLAGIAASLLVVVFMGNTFLSQERRIIADNISGPRVRPPAPDMPDPALEGYTKPGPDGSLTDELLALTLPPADEVGRAKEKSSADGGPVAPQEESLALNEPAAPPPPAALEKKSVAPAESVRSLRKQEEFAASPPPAASAPSRERTDGRGAAGLFDSLDGAAVGGDADTAADSGPGVLARRANDEPTLPEIVVPPSGGLAEEGFRAETETAAAPAPDGDSAITGVRKVEISEIAAVLVLDPSRAPLQVQSQILPAGGLAERVEEARRLAGGRPVIALYTIATGATRRDFAQVPLQTGLTQQRAAPPPLVGLLGVAATAYDFIALPAE